MKKLKMVVVGTGRCGTGYISKVLKGLGIPCGHEGVFGLDLNTNTKFIADSSWLAVPFLYPEFPLLSYETTVIHLVRNPIDVINSFCKLGFFNKNTSYAKFAYNNLKQLSSEKSQLENAIRWYIGWNGLIEERGNIFKNFIFHRVEDDVRILLKKLNIRYKDKEIFSNKKYNTVPLNSKFGIRPNIIITSKINEYAKRYGYKLGQ